MASAPNERREYDIQAEDERDIEAAVASIIQDKREQRQERQDLDVEATVRDHLHYAKEVLAVDAAVASDLLGEVHSILRRDGDIDRILNPHDTLLTDEDGAELTPGQASQVRAQFRRQIRVRDSDQDRRPNVEQEYLTLLHIARALGYYTSITDPSQYAPIRLESIDEPGTKHTENPAPVGRRRLPKDTTQSTEQASREIPHQSCDHILCVALPRSGKDSTLTSIGKNLAEEHGYKYVSVFDDGRMETPMLAVPNDEDVIQKNLTRLDQQPDAMDAEVFVPATPGLPDHLPSNFTEFKIGIDSLTPHLVLRLAGVTASDATAEDRIEKALETTLSRSGQVPELVGELQRLAEEQNATIEWTEKQDVHRSTSGAADAVETRTAHFEMSQSKALKKAAARIAKLAGDGIIGGAGAEKNIDMKDVLADQERAAVLCCNFLGESKEELKFLLIDLWLRLIYQMRDEYPRLPRAAVEIRELKNLAPSKIGDVRYKDTIKTLRQTIFFLSTNGGSRRILLLGSTQKLNDVYKPVRSNMATKILLRLGEEEIETLDRSYNFTNRQRDQLAEFNIGMGMLIAGGDKTWPIEWRGAPCGLGLGDHHWLDRYGKARGARVRESTNDHWPPGDPDWWVHVPSGDVCPVEEPPSIGEFYSEWYLLSSDFPDDTEPEDVERELIEAALAERREYTVKADISLADVDTKQYRDLSLQNKEDADAATFDAIMDRYEVPAPLGNWLKTEAGQVRDHAVRRNLLGVLEAVKDHECHTLGDIQDATGISTSTIANYTGDKDPLGPCIDKDGKEYVLTTMGEKALDIPWETVGEEVAKI
jgi:hypothetical protein